MKSIKLISSFLLGCLFIFLAVASGEESKENEVAWEKNKKESFCGGKFTKTSTIDAIDMTTEVVTILNCDGTYVSKEDWGTSDDNEEVYNNTVGRSSGNNFDFSGKWVIVDKISTEDVTKLANTSEGNNSEATLIRYTSNLGKTRYATIYLYDKQIWLSPIPYEIDLVDDSYEYKDLNMYNGSFYQ
jgi:hypothetical protein